jgi:hypothetical protein
VGHTGIADSRGVIYDFAGPYTIGVGKMAFGSPTRFVQLDPNLASTSTTHSATHSVTHSVTHTDNVTDTAWDEAVHEGNAVYKKRMHNLCWDNCHSHVAYCLNLMDYGGTHSRGMIGIGVWVFFCGKFTSPGAVVRTYLPFLMLLMMILYFSGSFA